MLRFSRQLLTLWLFLAILLLCQEQSLASSTISLVSSNSHFGIVHRIEAALYAQPNTKLKLIHLVAESVDGPEFFNQYPDTNLIVTIGSEALNAVLKTNTKVPILSVLIRKTVFQTLLKENNLQIGDPKHPITAIYLDQPLQRQLFLLQQLFGQKNKHIGVLLGHHSVDDQELLQSLANKHNLELTTIYVSKFENPIAVLDGLLNEADVVLAIPDCRIYNPKTARGILLTAFHKRVPLVGYSRTFANNGAIAAVYTSTKQIALQSAQLILKIIENKSAALPVPELPNEFTIAVNYQVARSLGIVVESEASLKYAIDNMEKQNQH